MFFLKQVSGEVLYLGVRGERQETKRQEYKDCRIHHEVNSKTESGQMEQANAQSLQADEIQNTTRTDCRVSTETEELKGGGACVGIKLCGL